MAPLIYVINLDRDTERMASVNENLARLGLSFERLPAVMGKDVPEWEKLVDLPAYAWRNRLDTPRAGEVSCCLSHLNAMETFLRTDAPWCVILKDDVEVLLGYAEVLRSLAEKDDWGLVKLFNFHSGMPVRKNALAGGHHLVAHLTRTTSSAAYIVNHRATETLLKSMCPITEQGGASTIVDLVSTQYSAEEAFGVFLLNLRPYAHGDLRYLRCHSAEGAARYRNGRKVETEESGEAEPVGAIALLHIDSNHSCACAKENIKAWTPAGGPGQMNHHRRLRLAVRRRPRRAGDE